MDDLPGMWEHADFEGGATDLDDRQVDRLRGEMVRVEAMREVANMMTDIVIESVTAGVEDEDERKSVVHMVIIKLQEYRDS